MLCTGSQEFSFYKMTSHPFDLVKKTKMMYKLFGKKKQSVENTGVAFVKGTNEKK